MLCLLEIFKYPAYVIKLWFKKILTVLSACSIAVMNIACSFVHDILVLWVTSVKRSDIVLSPNR